MFGSKKNKNTQAEVEVNMETMDGNLRGENGSIQKVSYKKEAVDQKKQVVTKGNKNTDNQTATLSVDKNTEQQTKNKESFKSPFTNNSIELDRENNSNIPTFSNSSSDLIEKSATETTPSGGSFKQTESIMSTDIPQKNNSAFLHQSIDKEAKKEGLAGGSITKSTPLKKKSNINSFLLIIIFIVILAGILFGGYYFYMHKQNSSPSPKKDEQVSKLRKNNDSTNKTPVNSVNTTNSNTNQNTINQKTPIKQKAPIKKDTNQQASPKDEKFITTIETFNDDLAKFIADIKQRRSSIDLKNGIIVSPMLNQDIILPANDILKTMHMTDFFQPEDLKENCKLFIIEDQGNLRIAVIFELTDKVDGKIIKNKIIQREKELMPKMIYLFVDGAKPTVPTNVTFSTNKENRNARYANYQPGVPTSSVDWNVLDLGVGELVYFATSKKTAEDLTEYFMRVVTK